MRIEGKSHIEFLGERDRELLRAFREALALRHVRSFDQAVKVAVRSRCRRFWISEERALKLVKAMWAAPHEPPCKGERLRLMGELEPKVREKVASGATLEDAVSEAVHSPASSFFLTFRTARATIYRLLSRRRSAGRAQAGAADGEGASPRG